MGKMLHLVRILYGVSHSAERTNARITDENHVYMFISLAATHQAQAETA